MLGRPGMRRLGWLLSRQHNRLQSIVRSDRRGRGMVLRRFAHFRINVIINSIQICADDSANCEIGAATAIHHTEHVLIPSHNSVACDFANVCVCVCTCLSRSPVACIARALMSSGFFVSNLCAAHSHENPRKSARNPIVIAILVIHCVLRIIE